MHRYALSAGMPAQRGFDPQAGKWREARSGRTLKVDWHGAYVVPTLSDRHGAPRSLSFRDFPLTVANSWRQVDVSGSRGDPVSTQLVIRRGLR